MRDLTQDEIDVAMDDNGESDEGCVAVETTVQELADLGAGTCCGQEGNRTFHALASKGYGHRRCWGWWHEPSKTVWGMFHIKIQTDKTAMKVERIAAEAHGSLRFDGDSSWGDYKEFEIE